MTHRKKVDIERVSNTCRGGEEHSIQCTSEWILFVLLSFPPTHFSIGSSSSSLFTLHWCQEQPTTSSCQSVYSKHTPYTDQTKYHHHTRPQQIPESNSAGSSRHLLSQPHSHLICLTKDPLEKHNGNPFFFPLFVTSQPPLSSYPSSCTFFHFILLFLFSLLFSPSSNQ